MEFIAFLLVAALSIASALTMILQRNAMYSALFLVLNFFCLAVFYVLMGAYFLAVVQVAVYAGAIPHAVTVAPPEERYAPSPVDFGEPEVGTE